MNMRGNDDAEDAHQFGISYLYRTGVHLREGNHCTSAGAVPAGEIRERTNDLDDSQIQPVLPVALRFMQQNTICAALTRDCRRPCTAEEIAS